MKNAEAHLSGTGDWLLKNKKYCTWKSGEGSNLLWIRSKPGCGKSVLAARLIQDISLTMDTTPAYIFCRRADQSEQSRESILGSLARQIIEQQNLTALLSEIQPDMYNEMRAPPQTLLTELLEKALRRSVRTFVVVDGLDECKEQEDLVQDLVKMAKDSATVVVLSQDNAIFERSFLGYNSNYLEIRPDHGENQEDLRVYVNDVFNNKDFENGVSDEYRNQVVSKAGAMFLWVQLFSRSLRNPAYRICRMKDIDGVPEGLPARYDDMLNGIPPDKAARTLVWLALLWILYAKRPMTEPELLHAISNYTDAEELKDLDHKDGNGIIVTICQNFVSIDSDGLVRLIHESVRTHLEGGKPGQPWYADYQEAVRVAHSKICQISLQYLLLKDFDSQANNSRKELKNLCKRYPLLDYAAKTWGWHAAKIDDQSPLKAFVRRLISSVPRLQLCIQIVNGAIRPAPSGTNALHLLAFFGLQPLAQDLLNNIPHLSLQENSYLKTPAMYSNSENHVAMTLWILDQTTVDGEQKLEERQRFRLCRRAIIQNSLTVLQRVLIYGHDPIVKLTSGLTKDTLLVIAVRSNHAAMVSKLLQLNADPNQHNKDHFTALHYAARKGNVSNVNSLLSAGACITVRALISPQTPLHAAAAVNAVEVIQALYKHSNNIDLDVTDDDGRTPLHWAASHNHLEAINALVTLGCTVDKVRRDGNTALSLAAKAGAMDTVKTLIQLKSDASISDLRGRTAYHQAAFSGRKGLLLYMLDQQPISSRTLILDSKSTDSNTVIHYITMKGDEEALEAALAAGGDGGAKNLQNMTPLHIAAQEGHTSLIRLLLKATRDPCPRDVDDETPLHLACLKGRIGCMKEMVRICCEEALILDINAANKLSRTPLHLALYGEFSSMAEHLITQGATSMPDSVGNYPIHIAARGGLETIVKHLTDGNHAGLTVKGHLGRLPIHCAAPAGKVEILKLLLDQHPNSADEQDKGGNTPAMLSITSGKREAIDFWLDRGVNTENLNNDGRSLLHLAASNGDIELVQRLAEVGCCNVNPDMLGKTPLLIAAEANQLDVWFELFKQNPEACKASTDAGITCLHFAAQNNNLELIRKSLAAGINCDVRDLGGRTPFHSAAGRGRLGALKLLENEGCDIHTSDWRGFTPLLHAINNGHYHVAKYLIAKYDKNSIDHPSAWLHDTALMIATAKGHTLLVKKLLQAGSDPSMTNSSGANVFDYSTAHPTCLAVLNKLGLQSVFTSETSRQVRARVSVRTYCYNLRQMNDFSVSGTQSRLSQIDGLLQSLLMLRDFESVTSVMLERCWGGPITNALGLALRCAYCGANFGHRDIHVCKDCRPMQILCKNCHERYKKGKNSKQNRLPNRPDLSKSGEAFIRGFDVLPTPAKYGCRDHEYFMISSENRVMLRREGTILDTTSGRLTTHFLQQLQSKYEEQPRLEPFSISDDSNLQVSRFFELPRLGIVRTAEPAPSPRRMSLTSNRISEEMVFGDHDIFSGNAKTMPRSSSMLNLRAASRLSS